MFVMLTNAYCVFYLHTKRAQCEFIPHQTNWSIATPNALAFDSWRTIKSHCMFLSWHLPTMVTTGAISSNCDPYCAWWFLLSSRLKLKSGWLSIESLRSVGGGGGGTMGGAPPLVLLLSFRITGSVHRYKHYSQHQLSQ